MLKTLPETPERARQELALQLDLRPPLIATKGYADPEVARSVARARALSQEMEATPHLARVVATLQVFYFNRGDLKTASELAEQFASLVQRVPDPIGLMIAPMNLGVCAFRFGELVRSRELLEQALSLYDPQTHSPAAVVGLPHDPKMSSLIYLAWALWLLGYPDQALRKDLEALSWTQELAHPHSVGFALSMGASVHLFRGEWQTAQEWAEAVMTLATKQKFLQWLASGTIRLGRVLAERGRAEEGIVQLREGIATYRAVGAELTVPYFLTLLAEAYEKAGKVEEGVAVLNEALAMTEKNAERWLEAEIYRLKGELLLAQESKNQKAKSKSQKLPTPSP